MKTQVINARIEPKLKSEVETIFQEIGLNATQAITLFYKQVVLNRGLPFEVKIPNHITQEAIKDAENNANMTKMSLKEINGFINVGNRNP